MKRKPVCPNCGSDNIIYSEKGAWIPIYFEVRDATRIYFDENFDPDPESGSEYVWSEGSFACDCNRALFWSRSGGEPDFNVDCRYDSEKDKPQFHIKEAYCLSGDVIKIDG